MEYRETVLSFNRQSRSMDVTVDIEDHGEENFHVRFGEKFSFPVPYFVVVAEQEKKGVVTFVIRRIGDNFFLCWDKWQFDEEIESQSCEEYENEIRRLIEADDLFTLTIFETVVEFRIQLTDSWTDDDGVETQDEISPSSSSDSD